MDKILRINYYLLWEVEVPDDITDEECKELVEAHAEDFSQMVFILM